MKPTWIIENLAKEQSFDKLAKTVELLGFPLIKIEGDYSKKIIRENLTTSYITVTDTAVYDSQCVIVSGSIQICKLIAEETKYGCWPILYSDFPKYKCTAYYSYFGPYLFNDKYCFISLKELERQKFDIWRNYGKDALIFIRPDSGEKDFQAGLLDLLDLERFVHTNKQYLHDLVLVSSPKNILWEGRFVVSKNKEVIAHSTYRFQGQVTKIPAVPNGALDFCKKLLEIDYYPDSVFCYDLCQDLDGNFWLLELTSFSSAGLYEANKADIVTKVSEIVLQDFKKRFNMT